MVDPAVKQEILEELDRMPVEKQRQVLDIVRSYRVARRSTLADLLPLVGSLDDESAREMIEAIDEGCERVDPDGW